MFLPQQINKSFIRFPVHCNSNHFVLLSHPHMGQTRAHRLPGIELVIHRLINSHRAGQESIISYFIYNLKCSVLAKKRSPQGEIPGGTIKKGKDYSSVLRRSSPRPRPAPTPPAPAAPSCTPFFPATPMNLLPSALPASPALKAPVWTPPAAF